VKILCAMYWILKISKAPTLTNQKILSEDTMKLVLNPSPVTWHRGTNCRPTDDEAEFAAIALRTTHSCVQSDICHSYLKHSNDSNTEYSPLFHNIQIDVHFLSVPLFRFTSSVSRSQQKFASEIFPSSLKANNNSRGCSWLPFLTALQNDEIFLFSLCAIYWMGYGNFLPN
jgi:hypothetical protein